MIDCLIVVFDVARVYQSNYVKYETFKSVRETIFKFWRYWALKHNMHSDESYSFHKRSVI